MAKASPLFSSIRVDEGYEVAATRKGVALKTTLLLGIALLSGILMVMNWETVLSNPFIYFLIVIGALISGIVGQLSVNAAKVCSFIYAICEGAMLGLLSFLFEAEISGIILSAVMVTFTIFCVMLLLYSTNVVRATGRFVRMMMGIGLTLMVVSVIYLVAFLINPNNVLIIALTNNPMLMILISGLILLYGAFMLVIDFEHVNSIVAGGFDKKYEWNAALGLMITIIWIYIEALRIIALFADRN